MALTELLFTADGRVSREEFWKGAGFVTIMTFSASVLIGISDERNNPLPLITACFLYFLAFWAWYYLVWKRCVARGYSCWMFLFSFVPIIGWVWSIIALGIRDGDREQFDRAG